MSVIQTGDKYIMDTDVAVFSSALAETVPEHRHNFLEIVYIISGKCTHVIDGEKYPVSRGNLLFINYNRIHAISGEPDSRYYNILIKPEFISENLTVPENAFALLQLADFEDFQKTVNSQNCVVTFSGNERDKIETLILSLEKEVKEKNPGYRLALKSGLNLLLIMIFRKMSLPLKIRFNGISEELLEYIRANSSEKLTLGKLAKKCCYNPSYFSRVFKAYTGLSLTEYIKTVRIENACRLIETTDMKINDIFIEVGYSDKTRFFRDFKQLKSISPKEYRKVKR